MYDPERLRRMVQKAGPKARPLLDQPLTYWHAKTDDFPHADRDCRHLARSRSPVAEPYALRDKEEGWCCHDCAIDPPDEKLVRLLEAFDDLGAMVGDFMNFRSVEHQLEIAERAFEAYYFSARAMEQQERHRHNALADYASEIADGCLAELKLAQADLRRLTPRRFGQPHGELRDIVVADELREAEGLHELDAVDWFMLYHAQPRRQAGQEVRLTVPISLLDGLSRSVRDLGSMGREPGPGSQQRRGAQHRRGKSRHR